MTRRAALLLCLIPAFALLTALSASAALEVIDSFYRPDRMLPEWNYFYSSAYKPGDTAPTINAAGALCVYIKNTGGTPATIDDFTLNGQGLKNGIQCDSSKLYRCDVQACGCYNKQVLVDAGAPAWWRVDPNPIPAGGTGEIYVRMRFRVNGTIACTASPSLASAVNINVSGAVIPKVAGYAMSPNMSVLYLYLRHPVPGTLPITIKVDGVDMTSNCTINGDADIDLVPVKCVLSGAFARGSFHTFQAIYADGSKATTGLRVFSDNFKCANWGCPALANDAEKAAHLDSLGRHSVNLFTVGTADLSDYLKTTAGRATMDQYGMQYAPYDPSGDRVYAYFLCDEPDVGEYNVNTNVAPTVYDRVGTLAQSLWGLAAQKKANYSSIPSMINVDETFKPYNYYIYGQLADVFSTDPYYTQVLCDVFWKRPWQIPIFTKAIFEYAHAANANAGCEPRPLHVILNACRYQDGTKVFRYGSAEEKRLEAYYAVAAGAKQLGYWWFTSIGPNTSGYNGMGDLNEPGSAALWRELGLVFAEMGCASQVLVNSCPTSMPISAPGQLWIRPLLSGGLDSLVLICVNDDHTNDASGTVVKPISNAEVSFDLPSWLASPVSVFEVDYRGVRDVSNSLSAGHIDLHLGRVDITRMIIITKDSSLKSTLQSLYTGTYGPRVQTLIPVP